jgi:amidase
VALPCDLAPTGSGLLDGRTLAVKDSVAVAGLPMALGSGLPGFTPARDAEVVARARAAGARVVAKAQCEAFLLGANSFSSRPEPVRNPHDPARSAGGSSSGSAAMVASGLADLAIGTDSGGSIRIPAAFCGVVGFKPTRGRVPCTGSAPMEPTLGHAGPIARTVGDAAALFSVMDGADGIDPRQAWALRREGGWSGAEVKGLRIGVFERGLALATHPIADALAAALERLEAAGAERLPLIGPSSKSR